MSKVRSTADLLLLMCIASTACPDFGNHDIFPLDVSRFEKKTASWGTCLPSLQERLCSLEHRACKSMRRCASWGTRDGVS
jgi:hypothetical protein